MLTSALELLEQSRKEDALDALLVSWRKARAPEIADVIDVLSDDLTRSLAPVDGKTRRLFQESWLDIATENRSSDVGRLLVGFTREPCTQIPERLARFEARDHDPRVARELWAMVGRCPCTSSPNLPLWTRIFRLLADLGDVRMRAPLEAKLAARRDSSSFYDMLYPRIEKTLAALVDPPPLGTDDKAAVKRLAKLARDLLAAPPASSVARPTKTTTNDQRSEDELLALVFEDPEADGPRLVYGDWLLERNDPRGELITLQFKKREGLTKSEDKRERALLKKHGRRWLGALEPVIGRDGIAFERGFLSACTPAFRTKRQLETLTGHAAWSSVRRLDSPPFELASHPVMRSLRIVTGQTQADAARLAELKTPLLLEELHFSLEDPDAGEQARIGAARALPNLRRLTIRLPTAMTTAAPPVTPSGLSWLLESALARQLEHLSVVGDSPFYVSTARPDLGPWLEAVAPLTQLQSLSFDVQFNWKIVIARVKTDAGQGWGLELHAYDPGELGQLEPVLRGVPPKTFHQMSLPSKAPDSLVNLLAAYRRD